MVIQSNQISLTLDDAEKKDRFSASVPAAREGGTSRIQWETAKDCTVQKEAGKENLIYTEAEAKQLYRSGEKWPADSPMSPADFISRCMTGEDAKALSEEETPLEEYTSSQLDRAITRIKEERRNKQEAVEHQVAREREEAEYLEQMQDSGLPATPENVMRLSHAIDMAAEIDSFSEASMKFFIGNEYSLTPENISASVYGAQGSETGQNETAEQDFSLVEEQVQDLLVKEGMEPDEKTMETARWLYEKDLPVTVQNLRTCGQLEELKAVEPEVIARRIVDQMAEGIYPEKADLKKYSVAEAITARRRLEEIRLTMTIDAVRNMSAKGIDLDVSNLENMVAELRKQEKLARQSLLEEAELPVTEDNLRIMGDTVEAARRVLAAPVEFLGYAWQSEETDTLPGLSEQAQRFTDHFKRAEQGYDAVGTQVRRDLGDSMAKAFGNVDDILLDLGLETTARNQRAVRSLAYNQMALTEENVLRMKEYDNRVTTLMESLKPQVVSELIRRDINPLAISLEELSERVKEIQEEMQIEDISFSKYLWKLDHQKAVSPEERESMIGIYRLLRQIEKSDGAVVGQLLKEGRELTLSGLLSAVRSRRRTGMDVQVDDAFGEAEETAAVTNSISRQIETAYQTAIVKETRKNLSPSYLHRAVRQEQELSLEQLCEACEREGADEEKAYYQEMAEGIRSVMSGAEKRILDYLETLDLPDTAGNIRMMQVYLQRGSKPWNKLWEPEESEDVLEHFDNPEELDPLLQQIDEKQKEELAKMETSADIDYEELANQSLMNRRIAFHGKIRDYQMYEVPVFTEQGITACNVTIRDGKGTGKGIVEIAMESEEFGRMQATFKVKGNRVNSFVTLEESEQLPLCQRRMDGFVKDLEEKGFTMEGGSLVQGSRDFLPVGDRAEGAKNKDLYRIAKTFIIAMNRKDDGE